MGTYYSQLNDEDKQTFKDWLKSHLNLGPVTVTFFKKDGTERTMLCTTSKDLVEAYVKKTERIPNTDTCFVYDLEAKGWRSFRYDTITQVRFDIG